MTRIRLRPEPAGADLLALEEPPDWAKVFGVDGPLELEIGCGAGGFALEYARRNPAVRYVAFEWRKKYAREVLAPRPEARPPQPPGDRGRRALEVPRIFAPGLARGDSPPVPRPLVEARPPASAPSCSPTSPACCRRSLAPAGASTCAPTWRSAPAQMLAVLEERRLRATRWGRASSTRTTRTRCPPRASAATWSPGSRSIARGCASRGAESDRGYAQRLRCPPRRKTLEMARRGDDPRQRRRAGCILIADDDHGVVNARARGAGSSLRYRFVEAYDGSPGAHRAPPAPPRPPADGRRDARPGRRRGLPHRQGQPGRERASASSRSS